MKKPRARINGVTFALMLREFQGGPCSATELVELTGYCRHTIVRYLRTLHQYGCLHIVSYERDAYGRERSAIYALGEGRDRPRKSPEPWVVTDARWRAKQRLKLVERLAA